MNELQWLTVLITVGIVAVLVGIVAAPLNIEPLFHFGFAIGIGSFGIVVAIVMVEAWSKAFP